MRVGVPREIKPEEFRVGMTPAGARTLADQGHQVLVEAGAGQGSGIADQEYLAASAELVTSAAELYRRAEMIVKVKEPLPPEYPLLREGLILFTYLHLAPLPELTRLLLERKVIGIAYETVELENGFLPLLAPMSQVAGRMAVQVAAHFLERQAGGRGILLGGVPGVAKGRVLILGSGTVASNAAQMAVGLGAEVTVLGRNLLELARLEARFAGRLQTLAISRHQLEMLLPAADAVIGAVLVAGHSAPKLVTRKMLTLMQPGSIIVDVAIDQGGCVETSRPTFHADPVYQVDGILHYAVANMPGAVPRTATFALTNATLPYVCKLAEQGVEEAARHDPALARGINVYRGLLVNRQVASSQGCSWQELPF